MRCLSLILLFLCSVFGYTQDTLLHRDTAITAYTAKGIKLIWEKDASTKYAFDDGANKPKELQKEYGTTKDAEGKEVFIPYKAVLNGKEDVVNAVIEITDTALNRAEVLFKTLTGKSIPVIQQYKTPNGRKYTLQLKGAYDYAIEEVVAMLVPRDSGVKQQVVGSFKLVHLSPKTVNITLVPLDAQAQRKIQGYKEELQKIYDSIGVAFNIKEEPVMDISSIVQGNEIVSEDAEAMSSYSQQQQQINAMYKGQSNERYVVFITSKRASTGQGGYMRLNGQYGYVYGNADAKTLAHEIGHGVFRLEHPWSKYKITKNSSNLLLDYKTGGRELCHLDWQQINDPAFKLYAFQSQSEGEMQFKCYHEKPTIPGSKEGQLQIVKGKMSAPNPGYFASTVECEVNYYYHIAENQSSTYKTGWYEEEQYCKEIIKPLLEAFGILAGHITVASINIARERINASYRIEQFFNSKSVSEDILKTFVTSYYQEICKDASKRLGSSGSIEESNLLFDIVLAFTGFTETKALFQYAGGKLFATVPKLFASKTGKGIELLGKAGGEKIATYTDDVLMEIKYIETGGEVLGNTAKIKILEDGKPIETVLQIIKKEGQLGFRKTSGILEANNLLDKNLIAELKNAGVKFTESDLKWIFKNSDGKILFLEKGNIDAGLEHILNHKNEFIEKGIQESDISDFVMTALKENKIVGYQGTGTGRPIYELIYKGKKQKVAITTGNNGFVVGANPKSF